MQQCKWGVISTSCTLSVNNRNNNKRRAHACHLFLLILENHAGLLDSSVIDTQQLWVNVYLCDFIFWPWRGRYSVSSPKISTFQSLLLVGSRKDCQPLQMLSHDHVSADVHCSWLNAWSIGEQHKRPSVHVEAAIVSFSVRTPSQLCVFQAHFSMDIKDHWARAANKDFYTHTKAKTWITENFIFSICYKLNKR